MEGPPMRRQGIGTMPIRASMDATAPILEAMSTLSIKNQGRALLLHHSMERSMTLGKLITVLIDISRVPIYCTGGTRTKRPQHFVRVQGC